MKNVREKRNRLPKNIQRSSENNVDAAEGRQKFGDTETLETEYRNDLGDTEALETEYRNDLGDTEALETEYRNDLGDTEALETEYRNDLGDTEALETEYRNDLGDTETVATEKLVSSGNSVGIRSNPGVREMKIEVREAPGGKTEMWLIEEGNESEVFHVSPKDYSKPIGNGGQATVFKCHVGQSDSQGSERILKLYKKMGRNNESTLSENLRKVMEAQEQNHPGSDNVVRILQHGKCKASNKYSYYVVMPVYEQIDRRKYQYPAWKDNEDAYAKEMCKFIREIKAGLDFIHNINIVHGDIKPNNIVYDGQNERAVIIDLGASVQPKNQERGTRMKAMSYSYLPIEAKTGGRRVKEEHDFFSLGVTIAEYIGGVHPELDSRERSELKGDKYSYPLHNYKRFYLPSELPEQYLILLEGMLYQYFEGGEEEEKQTKKYRWGTELLGTWLYHMKNKNYDAIRRMKQVDSEQSEDKKDGELQKLKEKERINEEKQQSKEDDLFIFDKTLQMVIGNKFMKFHSLYEVADYIATDDYTWNQGVDLILNDPEEFDIETVGEKVHKWIMGDHDRMRRIKPGTGKSVNAVMAMFLLKFMTDKKKFFWKDKSQWLVSKKIHDFRQGFGVCFLQELQRQKSRKYQGFWDWKQEMQQQSGAKGKYQLLKATELSVILGNGVLSQYLDVTDADAEIQKICRQIEDMLKNAADPYQQEEIALMYQLAYMLQDETNDKTIAYTLPDHTKINSYQEFHQRFTGLAADQATVEEAEKLWDMISDDRAFQPEFYGWLMYREGRPLEEIRFE